MNFTRARQILGSHIHQHPSRGEGQQHPGCAADQRNQQALQDHRLHDLPAGRAQGPANGEFALPLHRAHQLKMGHVDTRDQQNEADCGPQKQKRRACISYERLTQRLGQYLLISVRFGVCSLKPARNPDQFCLRSLEGCTGAKARYRLIVECRPLLRRGPQGECLPYACLSREVEAPWQYAHNLHRLALHVHRLAQGSLSTAEVIAGKLLADQGRMMRIGIAEQTPRNRLQAEDARKVRIHESHSRVDRMIAQLHAQVAAAVEAHSFDTSSLVAYLPPIRSSWPRRGVPAVRPVRVENGEFVGIPVGERSEQNRLNHGKDGGVCPDTQSQSQRRRRRKYLVLPQLTPSEAQVAEEASGDVLPAICVHPLFGRGHTTAFEPGGPPRVLSRKSTRPPRRFCLLEVLLYFLRRLAIVLRPVREPTQAVGQLPPE